MGRRIAPPRPPDRPDLSYLESAPAIAQRAYQCGPAALASVMRHWGRPVDADAIGRALQQPGTRGVLNFTLAQYARAQGFWTEIRTATLEDVRSWVRRGVPPIVMLQVGPVWLPLYHFVVVTGFNDPEQIVYANVGESEPRAIRYPAFLTRWKRAGYWTVILAPPERVDWTLRGDQAADLALLAEHSGQFDTAIRWYQAALQEDPTSAPIRFNLANSYLQTRQWDQAKVLYRALVAERPGWGPYSNNLAWLALQEGRPQEAARLLEAALAQGAARRHDLLDTLGLAYCRLHRTQEAQACFTEALAQLPPTDSEARPQIQAHLAACQN